MVKNNILKIVCVFLFTCFSLHIVMLNLDIVDSDFLGVDNVIYLFYLSLWLSMNQVDIIWFILGVFIFDFYYSIYFVEGCWKINRIIVIAISIVMSVAILGGISLYNYHNLQMLYISAIQVYKCLMTGIGYYFIIYALLKEVFFVKKVTE